MGKINKKDMPLWAKTGHKRPVSRRDFLAAGLIPFAASAFVPGALGLVATAPSVAGAAECAEPPSGLASFMTLNLSGGAALMANLLPRDQAFNPLENYRSLGYPSMPAMATEYGSASWSSTSGLLAGLNTVITDAGVKAKVQVLQISVASVDDSGNNRFDASGMVYAAGLRGSLMPNLGRRSTATGLSQMPAHVTPPQPLVVNSVNDVVNALGYTAALNTGLTANQKQKLATLVGNLSSSQARKLASVSSAAHVKDLVECAGVKNATVVGAGANLVNPFAAGAGAQAQAVATIWNANGNPQNSNQVFGAMVYNGLLGQAGSVNLELGGYDYHDGTRTTGDTRDREAGVQIGKIIMCANLLGKKVAVSVTSDGSVSVGGDGQSWVADRGQAGSSLLFLFDPAGRAELNGPPQIGHYNSNGNSQTVASTLVSDPQTAALATFRNYIAFNGASAMAKFDQVFSRGTLTPAQLESITKVVAK